MVEFINELKNHNEDYLIDNYENLKDQLVHQARVKFERFIDRKDSSEGLKRYNGGHKIITL